AAAMELAERMVEKGKADASAPPRSPHADQADVRTAKAVRPTEAESCDLAGVLHDEPQSRVEVRRFEPKLLELLERALVKVPFVGERVVDRRVKAPCSGEPELNRAQPRRPLRIGRRTVELDSHLVVMTDVAVTEAFEQRPRT